MTQRIEDVTGVVSIEVLAPGVDINWNPITNDGPITFSMAKYVVVDGVLRPDIAPSSAGLFSVNIADIAARLFVPSEASDPTQDPVTGADLTQVSVYGVMMIIKAAFNTLYAEWLTTQQTANV